MAGYIYTGSKHRRSGTTMQKVKARGETKRWNDVRRVEPGYPAKPFTTEEQVQDHVSGDKIHCLLCGRLFKDVTKHLPRIHDISVGDYRVMFNIPFKFPLSVEEVREVRARNALRNNKDGRLDRGRINSLSSRAEKGRGRGSMTKLGTQARAEARAMVDTKGRHNVLTDCAWHLAQVARHFKYRNITPPEGELSWSGYKKRRRREPELQKLHEQARHHWDKHHKGEWLRNR